MDLVCRSSEVCKSDVEIVRLVGGHTGCQILNYNKCFN